MQRVISGCQRDLISPVALDQLAIYVFLIWIVGSTAILFNRDQRSSRHVCRFSASFVPGQCGHTWSRSQSRYLSDPSTTGIAMISGVSYVCN